jgi:tetratricopeptide (TPR) repeat protein
MAKRQYEERDLDGLEVTLRMIIEKDPGAARAYHLLGTLYLERKDEETALRIFSEAVNLFPRDPMLHHDLGTLYYKRGFHELARQELSKALEVAPHFPKAEQARKLLLSLKQIRLGQPLEESPPPPLPPPPVVPQENPDVVVDAPVQPPDEPTAQADPEPAPQEQGQTGDQPPPPETGTEIGGE